MAMLGLGDYMCEACKFFDTDGIDGNHPSCSKQPYNFKKGHRAITVYEECPYGYEFGIPSGYPVSMDRNEKRAHLIAKMLKEINKKVAEEKSKTQDLQTS